MDNLETSTWGPIPAVLNIESEACFSDIKKAIHDDILLTMRNHQYNTLGSFMNLHRQYRKAGNTKTLEELRYSLPVTYEAADCTSCIGMTYQFMSLFKKSRPDIYSYIYFVTGDDFPSEILPPIHQNSPSPEAAREKGHILAGLEFKLMGRRGYILIDVGLALDIPIVVMRDGNPPHTGTFAQVCRFGIRECTLRVTDPESDFVIWNLKEKRVDKEVLRQKFLYVGRSFLLPDELERRNWYEYFHGKIFMGPGGVIAGFYFTLGKDSRR